MNKRIFKYFFLGLVMLFVMGLAVAVVSLWPKQPAQISREKVPVFTQVSTKNPEPKIDPLIPLESIKSCLPEGFLQADLLATHDWKGQKLYYLSILSGDSSELPLILAKKEGCEVINRTEDGSQLFLSQVLPQEVAKKMAIERYEKIFERVGGKEKFQDILNKDVADSQDDVVQMSQENYDALKHLGIKIPAAVKPIKEFPKTPEANFLSITHR